ncbi:MAG: hypothetical protein Q9213_005118 [Squamulea squamosa]
MAIDIYFIKLLQPDLLFEMTLNSMSIKDVDFVSYKPKFDFYPIRTLPNIEIQKGMAAIVSEAVGIKPAECKPYMSYDPLPKGYVRLLKIQPALNIKDIEDDIEISLISVPLAQCPPYVAWSYTWGDPGPFVDATTVIFTKVPLCYPIRCGGRLVLCTRNLRNALRRLRQVEKIQNSAPTHSSIRKTAAAAAKFNNNVHLYWIDAICINQKDVPERSTQVSLMTQIYHQAQCTIVWLGEEDTYTRPAMEVLWKVRSDQPMPEIYASNHELDYQTPAPATTAYLFPACLAIILGAVIGHGSQNFDWLATDDLVLEELRKLKMIFHQLNGSGQQPMPGLPNIDRMNQRVVDFYLQRGPGADYAQCICEAIIPAVAEQVINLRDDQLPPFSRFDASLVKINETTDPESYRHEKHDMILQFVLDRLDDRRMKNAFFRTTNTLGVAQPSVRSGDQIWFLHGAFTPIILRPLATGEYRFMGEAYVHGVMYGEAGADCTTHERISIV